MKADHSLKVIIMLNSKILKKLTLRKRNSFPLFEFIVLVTIYLVLFNEETCPVLNYTCLFIC